jgi:selenide, water dikinase
MADLAYVLRQLPRAHDANLLVGDNPADDAAVYRLSDDLALIQTVDFFTPVVDDPFVFGQIAAANSLSDVYAMGGRPLTALNIVGFPIKSLPAQILGDILRGGADIARSAGVTIVGGHTVDDDEPKYGLSVTGTVHPDRYISAHGARPGDVLVLTKPIGTGVITTALKAEAAHEVHVSAAVRWMTTLNRAASEAMMDVSAHAATDITGFGLLGHLTDLCMASHVSAVLDSESVPLLPGALDYARMGHIPGGTRTNVDFVRERVSVAPRVSDLMLSLLNDAQTSGGLLIALDPTGAAAFARRAGPGVLAAQVGQIVPQGPEMVRVTG